MHKTKRNYGLILGMSLYPSFLFKTTKSKGIVVYEIQSEGLVKPEPLKSRKISRWVKINLGEYVAYVAYDWNNGSDRPDELNESRSNEQSLEMKIGIV